MGNEAQPEPLTTVAELIEWIGTALAKLEPMAAQLIGDDGVAYSRQAANTRGEYGGIVAIRLTMPSPGWELLESLRGHVDRICSPDFATELWHTFSDQNLKRVSDLRRAMRWCAERLTKNMAGLGLAEQSDSGLEAPKPRSSIGKPKKPNRKVKRGRDVDTDPVSDAQLCDQWQQSGCRTYAQFVARNGNGLTVRELRLAIDRTRSRS
jgi:hypothetical protein